MLKNSPPRLMFLFINVRKALEIDGAKDPVRTVRSAGYSLEAA